MNAHTPMLPGIDSPPLLLAKVEPEDTSRDFDWCRDATIVVEHQAAIAVYRNPRDAVVIREEGQYGADEDHWVVVSTPEALKLLIAALQRELKEW